MKKKTTDGGGDFTFEVLSSSKNRVTIYGS